MSTVRLYLISGVHIMFKANLHNILGLEEELVPYEGS